MKKVNMIELVDVESKISNFEKRVIKKLNQLEVKVESLDKIISRLSEEIKVLENQNSYKNLGKWD